jgi:enterochelin esterase family protein
MENIKKFLAHRIAPLRKKKAADPWAPRRSRFQITSRFLKREVTVRLFLPPTALLDRSQGPNYPFLLFNDGQDLEAIRLSETLQRSYRRDLLPPIYIVGVDAGDRMHEYGVIDWPDYKKRGSKAAAYRDFLFQELLPRLEKEYPIGRFPSLNTIAGFSLGGLSAMDLAWNHPEYFGKVGVFSGSFWWRSKEFDPQDPDADRIMHEIIEKDDRHPALQFWLQTGTNDETSDRNNNGIIDAIDDTLDIIKELKKKGYTDADIHYEEIEDGVHHPKTWGHALPLFLQWAYHIKPQE